MLLKNNMIQMGVKEQDQSRKLVDAMFDGINNGQLMGRTDKKRTTITGVGAFFSNSKDIIVSDFRRNFP